MAVKLKLARPRFSRQSLKSRDFQLTMLKIAGAAFVVFAAVFIGLFSFYYSKYKKIVDQRLEKPLFVNTAKIYAAPHEVRPGQKLTVQAVGQELRDAGYSEEGVGSRSEMGTFSESTGKITVHPGPHSYHSQDGATIDFSRGLVSRISGDNGQELGAYELEPLLITGLSEDKNRTKRRLITYDEIPQDLVHAVLAIEDRKFFEHGGVNYYRMLGAMWSDLRSGKRGQGGSTLTMQLARGFFLTPQKSYRRKVIEILITFQLENRFNKQQLFAMYANEIPLGQRGSFAINGFGEAARAYFGKDIRQLTLPECALLAGIVQSPSRLNPYRHPRSAVERRNVVLDAMEEIKAITPAQAEAAKASPLKLATQSVDANEAPYFVDLVREQLVQKLGENDYNHQGLRIYTSLDPNLQQAASDAVDEGMKLVDAQILKRHTRKAKDGTVTTVGQVVYPQVALVALNPHTGQVLALVGGRNYGLSQLNRAIAKRPTGSIFKPFVYAAAFNTSLSGAPLQGQQGIFTPVTMLNDEQTTFNFDNGNQTYTPRNYKEEYHGEVTAIYALAHSLNNATISLAEMVGFENIAALARDAGVTSARGTPSVALGTYSASPLEMAGAYTVFANNGVKIDPWMLASVRSPNGDVVADYNANSKPVLDPRVAFLTTSMMEGVMNFGYGYEARKRGFLAPAAGKTGTSHDAWFAGYTSNLLCIVWIGNDDYSDIKLTGGIAAAPIWAEFMKRAVKLPEYSDTKDFVPPSGVVEVKLDKVTNLLSDEACPQGYSAAFLDGTQPTDTCDHPNLDQRNIFQKIFGVGERPSGPTLPNGSPLAVRPGAVPAPAQPNQPGVAGSAATAQNEGDGQNPEQPKKKKKGFFSRIFGGGDDDPNKDQQKKKPDQQQPQQQPQQ